MSGSRILFRAQSLSNQLDSAPPETPRLTISHSTNQTVTYDMAAVSKALGRLAGISTVVGGIGTALAASLYTGECFFLEIIAEPVRKCLTSAISQRDRIMTDATARNDAKLSEAMVARAVCPRQRKAVGLFSRCPSDDSYALRGLQPVQNTCKPCHRHDIRTLKALVLLVIALCGLGSQWKAATEP